MRGGNKLPLIVIALWLIAGCSSESNSGIGGFFRKLLKGGGSAVPVTVVTASLTERPITLSVPGTLIAGEKTEVRLPFEARVDRVFVSQGDIVAAGDRLLHLSEEELTLRVAQKREELKDAQSTLEKNSYFLNNRDRLLEEGRLDRNQYETLEAEVATNESALEKLRTDIQGYESQFEKMVVTSPVAGMVESKNAAPGVVVPANTPLVTLVKTDPIIVEFQLATHEASAIAPSQEVSVRIIDLPGEHQGARITSVGTEINRESNTFTARAAISNPQGILKGGMTGEVSFTSTNKQRFFLIPAEALLADRYQHYVFTVVKGVAHRVRVVPRETQGVMTEVVEGLREDDLVVVKGNKNLEEGTVVDIWGK